MPAVDTNVVVRYLTGDDAAQARAARKLVDGGDIALSGTVLLETEWVLRSLYGYDRRRIHAALTAFAGLANVELDDPARAARAFDWFGKGMDFADALHLAACREGEAFATFDRKLATAARKAGAGKIRVL
ncbi:MAG TPA: type II toxin-antitoxin system VapC family toxin [Rhodanobacteraceae bacterium]|nr:type II toxin-antitoxin system VapC family toxin [Rhodanobacteraceae bacterium]